jgi:hypothetical protein
MGIEKMLLHPPLSTAPTSGNSREPTEFEKAFCMLASISSTLATGGDQLGSSLRRATAKMVEDILTRVKTGKLKREEPTGLRRTRPKNEVALVDSVRERFLEVARTGRQHAREELARQIAMAKSGRVSMAFDPEKHPHEPAGSSKGGEFTTVYHGTSAKFVENILKRGILSNYGDEPGGSVYAADRLELAKGYAEASRGHGEIVVFEVHVPKEYASRLGVTKWLGGRDTVYSTSDSEGFKPEWIKAIYSSPGGYRGWTKRELALGDAKVLFVPVVFGGGGSLAEGDGSDPFPHDPALPGDAHQLPKGSYIPLDTVHAAEISALIEAAGGSWNVVQTLTQELAGEARITSQIAIDEIWARLLDEAIRQYNRSIRDGLDESQALDAVGRTLSGLSPAKTDSVAKDVTKVAYNQGRDMAAKEAAVAGQAQWVVRSELLDTPQICKPCRDIDGVYLKIGTKEYEQNIPPTHCLGGDHCRGYVVIVSNELAKALDAAA